MARADIHEPISTLLCGGCVKPSLDGNNYSVVFYATGGAVLALWKTPDRGGWCVRMGTACATGRIRVRGERSQATPMRKHKRETRHVSSAAQASHLRPQPVGQAPLERPPPSRPGTVASRLALAPASPEARERDQMLDRLRHLRGVLPVLAQEMAAARRQAARLRTDNRRLSEQVRQLRAALEARGHKSA
jgi:hypothetical protein